MFPPSIVFRRRSLLARLALLLILVVSVGFAGCGGTEGAPERVTVYPVTGKVLLADGKPLSGGTVYFVPSKDSVLAATGKVGSDGTFKLATASMGEGAAPGEYKVRVEPDYESLPKTPGKVVGPAKNLPFPSKYTDEDGSGLTATVKPQDNQLEPFQLK